MNPIPLTAPDGRVYAYACGICHEACAGMHSLARPETPGPNEMLVEASLHDATRCCTCRTCSTLLPESRTGCCAPCAAIEEQQQAVAMAAAAVQEKERDVRRQDALTAALDRNAALLLAATMAEISEDYYCAGWLNSLEFDLWGMVLGRDSRNYGLGEVPEETIAELRRLSEQAGGWWQWRDDVGECFVTLHVWSAIYLRQRPPRRVVFRGALPDGTPVGVYEDEVCAHAGTCRLWPGHDGEHDPATTEPHVRRADDHVPLHPLLPQEV